MLSAAAPGKVFRWGSGGWWHLQGCCCRMRAAFHPLPLTQCLVCGGAVFVLQVNIIPIIAKADTIAKNELHKFKSKIMSELVSNGVQIYQFPTDEETVAEINATMSVCYFGGICLAWCAWAHPWLSGTLCLVSFGFKTTV